MKFICINIDIGFHRTKTYMGILDSMNRLCEESIDEYRVACKSYDNKVIKEKELIKKHERMHLMFYIVNFNIKACACDYVLKHYGFNSHYRGWEIVWAGKDCTDKDVIMSVVAKNENTTIK